MGLLIDRLIRAMKTSLRNTIVYYCDSVAPLRLITYHHLLVKLCLGVCCSNDCWTMWHECLNSIVGFGKSCKVLVLQIIVFQCVGEFMRHENLTHWMRFIVQCWLANNFCGSCSLLWPRKLGHWTRSVVICWPANCFCDSGSLRIVCDSL